MIRKILFGVIWFVVIFAVTYTASGILHAIFTGVDTSGGMDAGRAAGMRFAQAYRTYFFIGALVFTIFGTAIGILPGTKKKTFPKNTQRKKTTR